MPQNQQLSRPLNRIIAVGEFPAEQKRVLNLENRSNTLLQTTNGLAPTAEAKGGEELLNEI